MRKVVVTVDGNLVAAALVRSEDAEHILYEVRHLLQFVEHMERVRKSGKKVLVTVGEPTMLDRFVRSGG